MWVSSCWSYKHKTQLATADSFDSFGFVSSRFDSLFVFIMCVSVLLLCPFSFDFIVWHSGDNNNNRFPMKLSKAINFLSGTVFQRISWRTFWHFLDSIFSGSFSVDFFLSCFCWVSISIWFSVFVCCASASLSIPLFPYPPLYVLLCLSLRFVFKLFS